MSALLKDGSAERGLQALLAEAERANRFGFTASEFDRQKQTILRGWERAFAEKDNRMSASRADEYVRNFLTGESLPTADDEFTLHQQFLPEITLAEVNQLQKAWFSGTNNRQVIVTAPDTPGAALPTNRVWRRSSRPCGAGAERLRRQGRRHCAAGCRSGAGTRYEGVGEGRVGRHQWELSNGVKVVLKPTTFRQDEIVFRAFSPGGTSLAADADYIPANAASQLIGGSGIGKYFTARTAPAAHGQDRVRESVHRRAGRRAEWLRVAARCRDDVPADLHAVRGAARGSGRGVGSGRAVARDPGEHVRHAGVRVRRRSRRFSATTIRGGPSIRSRTSNSGTSASRSRSTRTASRTRAASPSSSSATSRSRRSGRSSSGISARCRPCAGPRRGGTSARVRRRA